MEAELVALTVVSTQPQPRKRIIKSWLHKTRHRDTKTLENQFQSLLYMKTSLNVIWNLKRKFFHVYSNISTPTIPVPFECCPFCPWFQKSNTNIWATVIGTLEKRFTLITTPINPRLVFITTDKWAINPFCTVCAPKERYFFYLSLNRRVASM